MTATEVLAGPVGEGGRDDERDVKLVRPPAIRASGRRAERWITRDQRLARAPKNAGTEEPARLPASPPTDRSEDSS